MPRIRRWFHVSHDINSDPEVWELTDRFGERAYRVWMEILSIADRYAGLVPGDKHYLSTALAAKCKTKTRTVEGILDYCDEKQWTVNDPNRRLRNHPKYNPSRDAKEIPSGKPIASPPILSSPSLPTLPEQEHLKTPPPSNHWGTPEALVVAYNLLTPEECPEVERLSPGRRQKASAYLKAFPDRAFWEQAFAEVGHSQFLRGLKNAPGHAAFVADFDWLLSKGKDGSENVLKVQEGKYRDGR